MATTNLTADYTALATEAKKGNVDRAKAIEQIFDKVIQMYGGGELLLSDTQSKQYENLQAKAASGTLNKAQQKQLDTLQKTVGTASTFGESYLDLLNKQKVRDVSSAQQGDISRGLYGLRDRGTEWESAVGTGARLKLEDLLTERLSSALGAKAGFLGSIEQPYPDYTGLTEAARAGAAVPRGSASGGASLPGFDEGYGTLKGQTAYVSPATSTSNATFFGTAGSASADDSKAYGSYLTNKLSHGDLGYAKTIAEWIKLGRPNG